MYMAGCICLNYLTVIVGLKFCKWFMTETQEVTTVYDERWLLGGQTFFCMCGRLV